MLMQPLLMRLRQRHPGARIDVMAPPWSIKLLVLMPEIDGILTNPFPHGAFDLAGRRALGRQLRESAYDQAIVLPNSLKSALPVFFAGIPLRTGFVGEWRYGLLNDARKLDKRALPLMVERFAQLAEAPGQTLQRPLPPPRLQVTDSARNAALDKHGLSLARPVVIFCPGAEYGPAKRWPVAYFAELAQHLIAAGYAVWLVGSPKDREVAENIVALGNPGCRNLCGETALDEAVALLSCARAVVSNDSGLMHIAAALDRPLLAVFGSSSPQFTPPLSPHATVLRTGIACSPCFKRECPRGHFDCMMQLTPQRVRNALQPLLES